ncbi:uncharacterized protein [Arachis hypogaea]|uniref:uncharacterized protein n=1 Tax=Arachis hypogaea TaxID=3818 RepID=UPI003B20D144
MEGRLKFDDGKKEMKVDVDPFETDASYVEPCFGVNMVGMSYDFDVVLDDFESQVRSVYPRIGDAVAIFENERMKKELAHREEQAVKGSQFDVWRAQAIGVQWIRNCQEFQRRDHLYRRNPQWGHRAPSRNQYAFYRGRARGYPRGRGGRRSFNQGKKLQIETCKETSKGATPSVHSRIAFPSDGETYPKEIPSPAKMEKGKSVAQSSGIDKHKDVDVDKEYFDEGDDDMPLTVDQSLNSYNCEGCYLTSEGLSVKLRYPDISFEPTVMKKNEKLRVCIDFRDLNNATPKDEYFMPIADMLIDSAAGNKILSFMDDYSAYNQIFIAENDVAKTAFRCLASKNTIGCMLAQDDENGHERALKCFMVAKSVKVIAQTDVVKYILSFPMLRGRLGKWMLALTEFDLQYIPAKTVKGQVIADFLVDNLKYLNDQGANIVDVDVNYWKLYFDGSKHKDGAGVGILIISPEGIPSEFLFGLKYPCSNNVAEYEPLILGLKILINKGTLEVQILGDSQLVLKQLSKEFKCNNETLQKYLETAWELLTSFQKVSLVHIPRIHNEIANELAQIASRYRIGPETIKKLSSIHQILVPANEREAGKKMRWVLYRNHVYWPSMIKDYIDYAKACRECQKHGSIQQILVAELHSIIKPWPFRGWALDLIGLIHPPSSKQHKFILVAIDYFTKWVEAIPLVEVGQSEIIDFIEENIIYRFGIPQTLSTDQGIMFTGQRIKNFAASRNIRMVTSTPYYAQANWQVEAANKILIGLIKKHIGSKPRTWHKTLSQVLWAYRNSPRGSTGTSPYKLVYGHDAVLPLEINLNTLRVLKQNDLPVNDYWNAMYDELNELDSERILALENIIRQKESVARSYSRRIKENSFKIGELVLKVILPMEKKSRFLGKWSHSWEGPFQIIGTYSGNAYQIKDIELGKVINSINGKYLKLFYCWQT